MSHVLRKEGVHQEVRRKRENEHNVHCHSVPKFRTVGHLQFLEQSWIFSTNWKLPVKSAVYPQNTRPSTSNISPFSRLGSGVGRMGLMLPWTLAMSAGATFSRAQNPLPPALAGVYEATVNIRKIASWATVHTLKAHAGLNDLVWVLYLILISGKICTKAWRWEFLSPLSKTTDWQNPRQTGKMPCLLLGRQDILWNSNVRVKQASKQHLSSLWLWDEKGKKPMCIRKGMQHQDKQDLGNVSEVAELWVSLNQDILGLWLYLH